MKWIFQTILFILGLVYIVYKLLILIILSPFIFIWEFKTDDIKGLKRDLFGAFFYNSTFSGHVEFYRYNTIWDFVKNNKNYDYATFQQKRET